MGKFFIGFRPGDVLQDFHYLVDILKGSVEGHRGEAK